MPNSVYSSFVVNNGTANIAHSHLPRNKSILQKTIKFVDQANPVDNSTYSISIYSPYWFRPNPRTCGSI